MYKKLPTAYLIFFGNITDQNLKLDIRDFAKREAEENNV